MIKDLLGVLMGSSKKTQRFMELEGLRGIAAIAVVFYHYMLAFYLVAFFGPNSTVQHFRLEDNVFANPFAGFISGTFAVSIFFVLSGFVLSIGYFQTKNEKVVQRQALKRYFRLMLPALASVFICYLLVKFGLSHSLQAAEITKSSWLVNGWDTAPHILNVIKDGIYGIFVNGYSPYNNVLWTMTTELLGSFLVFGTMLLFATSKYRWVVYSILTILSVNSWLLGFILGMVLADLFASGFILRAKRSLLIILPLTMFGVYLGGYPYKGELGNTAYAVFEKLPFHSLNYLIINTTIGAALILFVVLWSIQAANLLSKKYISGIGKYAFSLYLVHLPILFTFTTGVFVFLINHAFGYNKSVAASFVLSIPLIVISAYLFERYIDSKSVKFASRCADLYFNKGSLGIRSRAISVKNIVLNRIGCGPPQRNDVDFPS